METIERYLSEIRTFYYVGKCSSFTQAQTYLNQSKSKISKDISTLETVLGLPLFHRTTRVVRLTDEGERIFRQAEKLLKVAEETGEIVEEMSLGLTGTIRITAPGSLGHWFIPEMIRSIKKSHPEIRLEFDLNNQERSLTEDRYDFALRAMTVSDNNLISRFIGHIKDSIVVSPSYLEAHPTLLSNADPRTLADHECLLNSHQPQWNFWQLSKNSESLEVAVRGHYATTSYLTIRKLCRDGFGIAKLPFIDVHEDLENGHLIQLFPDYTITTHPLYLVYPQAPYRSQLKSIFKDLLFNWFKQQKRFFI